MVYKLFHVEQSWVDFLCKCIIGFRGLVLGWNFYENRLGNKFLKQVIKLRRGWGY